LTFRCRVPLVALTLASITAISSVVSTSNPVAIARSAQAPSTRCYTNQLSLSVVLGTGAAGHMARLFRLHNHSSRTCSLSGYPGVQLVDARGQVLPTHVQWEPAGFLGSQPKHVIELRPGANAYVAIEWAEIPTGSQACPVASALRIIPPNTYRSVRVQTTARVCGGNLSVSVVQSTPLTI
jgi:hypothetical protein